jgi:hypothetical protein
MYGSAGKECHGGRAAAACSAADGTIKWVHVCRFVNHEWTVRRTNWSEHRSEFISVLASAFVPNCMIRKYALSQWAGG